jgi:lactoylglutathione lyase
MEAAKEWYAKAFDQQPYFDEPFYIGFNIGGFELGLQPQETTSDKIQSLRTYWGVEDIQWVYDHLLQIGGREDEAPHSVGGPLMVASVIDPWGNFVGLIYNPTFKET